MSYMLRDRPDGQFEIVLSRPILVGIFPERDVASRVMFFLQEEEIDLTEDSTASFGQALRDAAAAEAETQALLLDVVEVKRPPPEAFTRCGGEAQGACSQAKDRASDGRLRPPDRSPVGRGFRAYQCGRKTQSDRSDLRPDRWAAALGLGATMSQAAGAFGGRRQGAMRDV
ncbi:hypothetical protein [Cypionkella sp. TWP1-2-1b2]|uniref:hypothetical protein n=1 Tax=Cypionkella sp. TWP1-2-1b2 TaxID=2804675 RepID=UPI003CEB92A0